MSSFILYFFLCLCSLLVPEGNQYAIQMHMQEIWRIPISSCCISAFQLTMKPNLDADEASVNARGPTKMGLFINHSADGVNTAFFLFFFFLFWMNLWAKSNLSTAHLHSILIKCDVVEIDNFIRVFSRILQCPLWFGMIGQRSSGREQQFKQTVSTLL